MLAGAWPLALFGGAGIVVLQLPAARSLWPRLVVGATRSPRDPSST
jgi:hypothetical protein